ncbi:MAG: hypothetical protein E6J42_08275 [Chloroflexi bacterium]|nr:MAG: hypothetical protein E6J42_08275 [Chloroflexota bacterium]
MLSPATETSYSALQLYFLRRLNRLLRLRSDQGGQLNDDGVRLIDRADLGVMDEAQSLLHRSASPPSGAAAKQ